MDFITRVPFEKTFLRVFDKPKKVRLNREVILFNYSHLSPFGAAGQLLYYQTDAKIYVWYFAEPASHGNAVSIPEAYLLYRFFRERLNAVILQPRGASLNALVIQQGELRAQVTLGTTDQDRSLALLSREYALHNPELIRLEATARFPVKPADIFSFAHFELNTSDLMEKCLATVKVPLLAALLVSAGFTYYRSSQLDAVLTQKKQYLNRLKRENAPLQSSLEETRGKRAYWDHFIAKEQTYPDFYSCLSLLTDAIRRNGGYISNFEYADNRITVWTGMKAPEATIIKDILALGLFQDVKLISTTANLALPGVSVYNLSITLRAQQKGARS